MMKILSGVVVAALLTGAGNVDAATYDFNASGPSVLQLTNVAPTTGSGPTITVTPGANGILNFGGAVITQNSNGLGVNGIPDTNPSNIDGSPILSSEFLTITFGWAVNLLNFDLGAVDRNDNFDISINGGAFVNGLTALLSNTVNVNNVTSFTIRASGSFPIDGLITGNDDFTLASIEVAPVPVPAAFGLLVMGLAGLGLARRGRKVA